MTKARELGDNAQNTKPKVIDAKGDLIVGTGADAADNLAAGASGETLVADSSTSTGLRYREDYAAGKNKIINGDFNINQRAFTTTTTPNAFGFDRWTMTAVDGTTTMSAETFTPGAAPEAGYESTNFVRLVSTGQTLTTAQSRISQPIEDVRTFAGQTVTVSFWAKASTGTPNIAVNFSQAFGSGGSSAVNNNGQKFAITSSWVRYTKTFSIPSVSGKTIGAGSFMRMNLWISAGSDRNTDTDSLGIQSITVDFWGIQAEEGSVATAFQTATGTLAGELAACQRYFINYGTNGNAAWSGYIPAAVGTYFIYNPFPVEMRIQPTVTIVTSSNSTNMGAPTVANSADWSSKTVRFNGASNGTLENRAFFIVSTFTASAEL